LGRPWQFDLDATHSGRSNTYSFVHKGVQHVLKPMLESVIKAEIFAPSRVKKRFAEITPKPRTALFQEGESDVINPVSITTANCSQGVPVMDSVVCEVKCKVSETAVDMRVSEGLAATKPIEFYSTTRVTHDAPVMASTAPEIDSNVSDGTAADPLKYFAIQFGCFSDKKVENEDNMAVIGELLVPLKKLQNLTQTRATCFSGSSPVHVARNFSNRSIFQSDGLGCFREILPDQLMLLPSSFCLLSFCKNRFPLASHHNPNKPIYIHSFLLHPSVKKNIASSCHSSFFLILRRPQGRRR
jgi:hypothetical protein